MNSPTVWINSKIIYDNQLALLSIEYEGTFYLVTRIIECLCFPPHKFQKQIFGSSLSLSLVSTVYAPA